MYTAQNKNGVTLSSLSNRGLPKDIFIKFLLGERQLQNSLREQNILYSWKKRLIFFPKTKIALVLIEIAAKSSSASF